MSIYVAIMDTENFEFVAVGSTKDEAISAMVETMKQHRTQYGHADVWNRDFYHTEHGHENMTDDEWLSYLARDYYGTRVSGPLVAGAPGTRDGSQIVLR